MMWTRTVALLLLLLTAACGADSGDQAQGESLNNQRQTGKGDGPTESGDEACSDGLDNDNDGHIDCRDYDCSRDPAVTVCPHELDDAACSDGLDNDGNGFVDCADHACSRNPLVRVCQPENSEEACTDGVDNDQDGLTDCQDPECAPEAGLEACAALPQGENSDADCSDGVDNDGDGHVDCSDYDCSRDPAVTVCAQEASDEACSDGLDNDGNGFVDCADWGCSRNPAVSVCHLEPEGGDEACSDGEDNDRDGSVDCDDEGCQATAAACAPPGDEASLELCTDGRDNDGDGVRDCQERACQALGQPLDCGHSLPDGLDELRGRALEDALYDYVRGQSWVSYDNARLTMFGARGQVDVENGWIECIYTGELVRPDGTTTPGNFNTEHLWPRSLGTDFSPARGDMLHLAPSLESANSARSSYPFGETDCLEQGDCLWSNNGSALGLDAWGDTVFQVRPSRRGDVARALFYVSLRYGLALDQGQEQVLRRWHAQDAPDATELARLWRVYARQQRVNPFILKPELVERIDDF